MFYLQNVTIECLSKVSIKYSGRWTKSLLIEMYGAVLAVGVRSITSIGGYLINSQIKALVVHRDPASSSSDLAGATIGSQRARTGK